MNPSHYICNVCKERKNWWRVNQDGICDECRSKSKRKKVVKSEVKDG
jgi:hypothetical protein